MFPRIVLCLALSPFAAAAWDSPEQAMDAFLAYELAGGRLQSDMPGLARHVHVDPDHEGIGADTIHVADRHWVDAPRCGRGQCRVAVRFSLPAAGQFGELPVANDPSPRLDTVEYRLSRRGDQWRVDADSLSELPYVSPAGLLALLATQQQDSAIDPSGDDAHHDHE